MWLLTLTKEVLDASHDRISISDLARDQSIVLREVFCQILEELTRPVWALHLSVAEHVDAGEQVVPQELDARQCVVHRPVIAVGEVKGIDVPFVWRIARVDDPGGES